jgi:hypothetical protein
MTKLTENDVASWMLKEYSLNNYLGQESTVFEISKKFGEEFVYTNENGNMAISRKVLNVFRSITSKTVVWDRSERAWRKREEFDEPSRQQ